MAITQVRTDRVQWGVIGCGQIALDKSVPALLAAQNARIAAISDPLVVRRDLVETVCSAQPGAALRQYEDYRALLQDPEVDAVYVALPTGMHLEAVLEATAAGKAILCEKPLGRSAGESREMLRAARDAGVPLMTGYMSRFSDLYAEAMRLIGGGAIGQVTYVYANFSYPALGPYPPGAPGGWRWTDAKGGGAVLDIGIYLAFALREILQDEIAVVSSLSCTTIAPPGLPNPDTTVAWFQTRKGIPGTFVTTFAHAESRILFYGTEGRLEMEGCFSQSPAGRLKIDSETAHHVSEQGSDAPFPHYDNYRREFEHFSERLLTGSPSYPTPLETLTDALLLDSLRQTSAAGQAVTIPTAQDYLDERNL